MCVIVAFNTTSFVCQIALLRLFTMVILTSQSWACFPVGFCLFACSWFSFICLVQINYRPLAQAGNHLAVFLPSPPGSWSDTLQPFLPWKPVLVAGLLKIAFDLRLLLCLWVSFTSELFPCFSAHKYCICWRLPLKHSLEAGPASNPMQMRKQTKMECSGKTSTNTGSLENFAFYLSTSELHLL